MLSALKQESVATHNIGCAAVQALQTVVLFRTGLYIAVATLGPTIAFRRDVQPDPSRCNCLRPECSADRHDADVQALEECDADDREADLQLWLAWKARQICQAECRREGSLDLDVLP